MICPVNPAHGEMWDNRGRKKNPKGPDFTCKEATCKYTYDKESGQWVVSAFKTGVWEPKKEVVVTPAPAPQPAAPTAEQMFQGAKQQEVQFNAELDRVSEEEAFRLVGEQKNRSNLAAAALRSGRKLDDELKIELSTYENWVLSRKFIPF